MTGAPPARLFRRSLTSRLTSLAALLLFGGAAVARLVAGDLGPGFAVVAALAFLGGLGAAGAWGDRIRLDARAVTIENPIWQALGRPPRRIAWEEVAALRDQSRSSALGEARLGAVFVIPRRGRPLPLDALDDLAAARALALAHVDAVRRDAATGSGAGDPPAEAGQAP